MTTFTFAGAPPQKKQGSGSAALRSCLLLISFSLVLGFLHPLLAENVQAQGETTTIQMSGPLQPPGFSPALLTIHVNDYVIFINQSAPAVPYAIAADDGSFSSPVIAPGKQWAVALTNPGAYEYHAISAPRPMVGEIVVVPDSIVLLPTPAPDVQATAVALIEAGKTSPDNLALPTPTPSSLARQTRRTSPAAGPWTTSLLLPAESVVILLCFATGGFFLVRFYRRRQKRKEADTDESTVPSRAHPRKSWLRWLKKMSSEEDEDDEDDDEAQD